ncbi:DUF3577 domain-containing protein [Suttonella indologenes]|uniref:Protein of uncharacterized function (DUF3577) n=1 Tax=Suttonella indologenes TaxID=13276 RepID=A0A380MJ36_9GAMM|nr:DUF3577 domain-containing protein [Suttonella indologenes]SUO90254.1 Protein of uncharacterised function (DUF3577) [Suttonella indologenes]
MNATSTPSYFDTVLYVRVFINEIKIVQPKKGAQYGAINASILDKDADGKTIYRTVDLIISGQEAKRILWIQRDRWPADRMQRSPERWVADINIGSLRTEAYTKKDGTVGAVLKGRLIKIRGLRIGDEIVFGEVLEDIPPATLVAPTYINLIDPEKGRIQAALLDGNVEAPEYRNINLDLQEEIPAINELIVRDLCPRGYTHRETNAKIFGILEIAGVYCEGFQAKDGNARAAMKGVLSKVRYLKANDEVIVASKEKADSAVAQATQTKAEPEPKAKAPTKTKVKTKAEPEPKAKAPTKTKVKAKAVA